MSESPTHVSTDPAPVSAAEAATIKRHVAGYLKIGACQVVFALATVGISFWNFGSTAAQVLATLLMACVNGFLVAGILMHLKQEKRTIWKFLIFTGIFFFVLFFLTYLARTDSIMQTHHTHH